MIDLVARKYAVVVYPGLDVVTDTASTSGGAACMGYFPDKLAARAHADMLMSSSSAIALVYKLAEQVGE